MNNNNLPPLDHLQKSLNVVRQLRYSSTASALLMLVGLAVVAGSFYYSITKIEPLERQLAQKQAEVVKIEQEIKEKQKSLEQLEKEIKIKTKFVGVVSTSIGVPADAASTVAFERRGKMTIEYFLKNVDQARVLSAIQDLGFKVKPVPPIGITSTNAIWFGSRVDIEDVKLVAYALIHAGVSIREIKPFLKSEGRERVIQIGGLPRAADKPPLTIEQIKEIKQFTR